MITVLFPSRPHSKIFDLMCVGVRHLSFGGFSWHTLNQNVHEGVTMIFEKNMLNF